jgi:hypothetical protein
MDLDNVIFLPIDIPKLNLDRDKVLGYFNDRKIKHQDWDWVEFKKYDQPIDSDLREIFPNLERIVRMLPFADFDNKLHIDFREQIVYNRPHQDPISKNLVGNIVGPTAYKNLVMRDVLETFYVLPNASNPNIVQYDSRSRFELNPVFPVLPDDTDWFALNNHKGFHGSFLAPKKFKKITMFFAGPLDEKKHQDLLERSFEKYKNYIIYN